MFENSILLEKYKLWGLLRGDGNFIVINDLSFIKTRLYHSEVRRITSENLIKIGSQMQKLTEPN